MKVLIDTNIILDWFLKREPFYENAKQILNKCFFGSVKSYLTIHSLCDLYYVIFNHYSLDEKKKLIRLLVNRCEIIEENVNDIEAFLEHYNFEDLEDCLQIQSAARLKLDYIITRNISDFEVSPIKAILPEDFLLL